MDEQTPETPLTEDEIYKALLESLPKPDKKIIRSQVNARNEEIFELKQQIQIRDQMMADMLDNVKSIETTLKNIMRIMSPLIQKKR